MAGQEQPELGLFGGVRVGAYQGPGTDGAPVASPAPFSGEEGVQGIHRRQWVPPAQQKVAGDHQIIEAQYAGEVEPRPHWEVQPTQAPATISSGSSDC